MFTEFMKTIPVLDNQQLADLLKDIDEELQKRENRVKKNAQFSQNVLDLEE